MATTPSDDDEAAIRHARLTQTQAIAAGDLDTVARYWTDDITIRRALGHPVAGIAAARQIMQPPGAGDATTALIYQRVAVSVEVSSCWPLAYEEGRWAGHAGDVSTQPVMSGRYSAQWVKRSGSWFIRSEVFVALACRGPGCAASALP